MGPVFCRDRAFCAIVLLAIWYRKFSEVLQSNQKCPNLAGPKPQNSFLLGAYLEDTKLSWLSAPSLGPPPQFMPTPPCPDLTCSDPESSPCFPFLLCLLHLVTFYGQMVLNNSQMYISNPKHALELPNFHIDWVFFYFSLFLETQTESLLFLIKATRAVFPRTWNTCYSSRAPPQNLKTVLESSLSHPGLNPQEISWASLVAQPVKVSACNAGGPGLIPGSGRSPGEMATHSSILAWEIPWTEEPGGL